jgi:ankyrin repeat protein
MSTISASVLALLLLLSSTSFRTAELRSVLDAITQDDAASVQSLLKTNPQLVRTTPYGYTLLCWAAMTGKKNVVEILLWHKAGADPKELQDAFNTAVWHGQTPVARLLLAHGAKLDINTAAGLGMVDTVADFLKKDKKLLEGSGDFEYTPLHWAIAGGQKQAAILLLDRGADIHARKFFGVTPLAVAVGANRLDMVDLLLSRKAKVDDSGSSETPLMQAIRLGGRAEMVALLLKHKADVNYRAYNAIKAFKPSSFWMEDTDLSQEILTPIHYAVEYGDETVMKILLAHNIDVNARAKGGTPLDLAIHLDRPRIAELLRAHGAKESSKK